MKHPKKIITALCIAMCLMISLGMTRAYFTDYEAAKGGAVLKLSGTTELHEQMKDNDKQISILNTGETDQLVRVFVIGDPDHLKVTESEDWYKGSDGAYYYTHILRAGENGNGDETSVLEAAVALKFEDGEDPDTVDFDIIVVHEASRVVYDGDALAVPDGWDSDAVSRISME